MSKHDKVCPTCLWVESIFMGFDKAGLPTAKYHCKLMGIYKKVGPTWNCGKWVKAPRTHTHLD